MSGRDQQPDKKQPVAPAPLSATATITVQRVLPLCDLLVVQLFAVAGMFIGPLLNEPRWYGATAGLGVAVLAVTRIRGLSVPRRASARLGFWYERQRHKRKSERAQPFNAELPDGSQIGFQWDGKILMSLVRILEDPQAITVMEPSITVSGQMVSAQALADCLQQFDIVLDSIDVLSQGARSSGHSQVGWVYEAVLGPLPAIARRSVWVAVRLDPTLCPDAVRHRSGGWQGIVRAATTATRRVANRLSDEGLRTQIMTADEIAQVTCELAQGVDLSTLDETWHACHEGRFEMRSYCLEPSMFTAAGIGVLWTAPTDCTTLCVSVRRDERDEVIKIRGLVRFDGDGRTEVKLPGLRHLPGMQYAALMCGLPLPSPRRSVGGWVFGKGVNAIKGLELPVSGCGQVVGADQHGRAVALPLFGPLVQWVEMCGTLHLAQQVVLRSLALGAAVHVHSCRPAAWRAMVEQVGERSLLTVNGRKRTQPLSNRNFPVELFDGAPEPAPRQGVTTMIVKPSHAEPSREADVTLQLLDPHRDLVRVRTRSASAMVTMVATPDEMRYITASSDIVDRQPSGIGPKS